MTNLSNTIEYSDWYEYFSTYKGKINLLYTDPPYGMNYKSNIPGSPNWNKSGKTESKFDSPIKGDDKQIEWKLFAETFYPLLVDGGYAFIHCNVPMIPFMIPAMENVGFKYKGTIAWNKKMSFGGDTIGAMRRNWEPILYFSKGGVKPKFKRIKIIRDGGLVERKRISEIGDDWTFHLPKKEKCGFQTQKPIELCKQIISLTTDEGDLVADPFCGSGSISIASKEINRNSISTEADKEVYDLAVKRVGNNVTQQSLGI